jgi:hypothetical protein
LVKYFMIAFLNSLEIDLTQQCSSLPFNPGISCEFTGFQLFFAFVTLPCVATYFLFAVVSLVTDYTLDEEFWRLYKLGLFRIGRNLGTQHLNYMTTYLSIRTFQDLDNPFHRFVLSFSGFDLSKKDELRRQFKKKNRFISLLGYSIIYMWIVAAFHLLVVAPLAFIFP